MDRRKFIIRAGLGIGAVVALGYVVKAPLRRRIAAFAESSPPAFSGSGEIEVWFELTKDGNILFYSPKVEMGQGILQALRQIACEELEISIEKILPVTASSQHGPLDQMSTGGSLSVSGLYQPVRELAATFREMMREQAAKILQADPASVSLQDDSFASGTKTVSLAEIAKQAADWKKPSSVPKLKNREAYKVIGKELPRFDLLPKVKGEAMFGIDCTAPDMLYGSVAQPPVIGAKFKSATAGKAAEMSGVVKIVITRTFAGVVAKSRFEAEDARKALEVQWEMPEKLAQQEELESLTRVGSGDPFNIQKEGDAASVLKGDGVIEAEFFSPFGVHAHLEPNGALAIVSEEGATIRMSTQVIRITRDEVAEALDLDKSKVNIEPAYLGGGFGRRLHTPHAIQAAIMARETGKPVHMFWTRQDEFQNGFLRPATHNILRAKLDDHGMIQALEHHTSSGDVAFSSPLFPKIIYNIAGADFGAWRGAMVKYNIPHINTVSWRCKLPIPTSWWRALGLLANTFAMESFIDELAIHAKTDALEFRLKHLGDDERGARIKSVLSAAADKAGWGQSLAQGHAHGLACSVDVNTPVAMVAEVEIVDQDIKVRKVTCAIDPGLIINPDGVKAQCEGAIIMSMSASLFEEVIIRDGKVTPDRLMDYPIARLKDTPDIEVLLLSSGDTPRGVGEPPMGPIAAAIANAVRALTGKRLNRMPLKISDK